MIDDKLLEIPAGTVVHIAGMPVELIQTVYAVTDPRNLSLIEPRLKKPSQQQSNEGCP